MAERNENANREKWVGKPRRSLGAAVYRDFIMLDLAARRFRLYCGNEKCAATRNVANRPDIMRNIFVSVENNYAEFAGVPPRRGADFHGRAAGSPPGNPDNDISF